MAIRDFRAEDFEQLWQLDQECFPPGISYSQLELRTYIHRRGAFTLVAHRSDAIQGFIVAESDGRGSGHIITIDVSPQERRSGVGSELLTAAEERLGAADCRNIYLETAVNNMHALAFYKRHKYEIIKTIPRYYDNSLDALRMVKRFNKMQEPQRC